MALTAYNGNQPYIFISYAHKDSDKVLPIVESLTASGFRVWYDSGIEAGTEWPEYIANKLSESACVIAFISKAALESQNCRREINYAISENKEMLSGVGALMCLGGALDVGAGNVKRAPALFIKLRLEWLWRMICEPKRMKNLPLMFKFQCLTRKSRQKG